MPLLDDKTRDQVKAELEQLAKPVTLHVFTQELECQYCRENRSIAEELHAIMPEKLGLMVHNFSIDKDMVEQYQIDKIPAIAVVGEQDYGLRFYGVPAGYEFTSLFMAIRMAGSGQANLSAPSMAKLLGLEKPLHLKVFVTLTCPYCPNAVQLAHQMAMASPLITAEMIEASEFPHLANKEQVMGVPKTVVTGYGSFEGALPEEQFVNKVLNLAKGAHHG